MLSAACPGHCQMCDIFSDVSVSDVNVSDVNVSEKVYFKTASIVSLLVFSYPRSSSRPHPLLGRGGLTSLPQGKDEPRGHLKSKSGFLTSSF